MQPPTGSYHPYTPPLVWTSSTVACEALVSLLSPLEQLTVAPQLHRLEERLHHYRTTCLYGAVETQITIAIEVEEFLLRRVEPPEPLSADAARNHREAPD